MDSEALLGAVDAAFVTTGADTPPWPDPHEESRERREEEYSRCLDPGKYRILKARADAWSETLTALGIADSEEVDGLAPVWRDGSTSVPDRAVRLRPRQAGAIPLLFAFRTVDGVPDTVVDIGAGEPAVRVETVPDCGCDACDDGSDPILELLDESVLAIVTGEFVHVQAKGLTVTATSSGWSASGAGGLSQHKVAKILSQAREGRSRHQVVRGSRWWH